MTLVRVLKNLGFENTGDLVDYRGVDLDERLANGDVKLYSDELAEAETVVTPEEPVEETPAEVPTPETVPSEPIVEQPVEPVVPEVEVSQ